ncbi:MAG: hypothetical protein H6Q52_2339 [Deltaproteobacteria bacterium]|nr:hypothetical protein [Deltaproteobacteria bacterium]
MSDAMNCTIMPEIVRPSARSGLTKAAAAEHTVITNGFTQRMTSHARGLKREAGAILARSARSLIDRDI